MSEQSPAVKAFNEYAKERIWHYARNTKRGISLNQTGLSMLCDFFVAGAVWGTEGERKRAATRKKRPKS